MAKNSFVEEVTFKHIQWTTLELVPGGYSSGLRFVAAINLSHVNVPFL